jgi:ribonuclease P protein component
VVPRTDQRPTRFGFIVAKTVGNAVTRNLVRRRLKAIAHETLHGSPTGYDVVIRALPAAAQASWPTLVADVTQCFSRSASHSKGVNRA